MIYIPNDILLQTFNTKNCFLVNKYLHNLLLKKLEIHQETQNHFYIKIKDHPFQHLEYVIFYNQVEIDYLIQNIILNHNLISFINWFFKTRSHKSRIGLKKFNQITKDILKTNGKKYIIHNNILYIKR